MQTDKPGTIIAGKYELLENAGVGGMAMIWRARTRGAAGFNRPVAVKRILPELANHQKFVSMFVEEARVGSQLIHPNIVQILDFGNDEQKGYYLVMEWVEGLDLGAYLKAYTDSNLFASWNIVTAIGIEVLRGLHAAHSRIDNNNQPAPIYHRDITPQNILIGINGITKLTDFGLARATDRARMTLPHIVKGKPSYLAPEMTRGEGPTVQTDLFGVGIVLWESLAGRRLFKGEDQTEVLLNVREGRIWPLEQYRPDLPPELTKIIYKTLAYSPSERQKSALEMARQLAFVLRSFPDPTDSAVLANSVCQARKRLGLSEN